MIDTELRTAAFVTRWAIMWKIRQDNVASHSFYVALYANLIADIIKWRGPRDVLLMSALCHDLDETITGDIIGPVKSQITDKERMDEYLERMMDERMPATMESLYKLEDKVAPAILFEIHSIVKAADRMDAILYLVVEERMGNSVARQLIPKTLNALEASWRDLPASPDLLSKLWSTEVLPTVERHKNEGGYGV